jgi:signal transduction histidine kinase/ActR/RegA family two-component response regulator
MVDRLTSAQERLEGANAELEQALDSFPGQVGVFDLEHRVLYMSPNTRPDPEWRKAAMGKTVEELFMHRDSEDGFFEAFLCHLDQCIARNAVITEELSVMAREGGKRHFIALFSPIRGPDGDPAKVITYGLDITDRRRTEEALAESEERYRQAQKMEAIGRLAGGVAHDFNNLLTAIYGHTEMAQTSLPGDHRARADLDEVRIATDRATRLTRQLLAFSRQQVLQPATLDLNQVVREMDKMIRRLIGEHIQVATELAEEPVLVFADRGQLDQVLLNLSVNAGDAMPEGGSLTIEVTRVGLGPEGCGKTGCEHVTGPHALLSVKDSGTGMDAWTQAQIFEPFFTTKALGKGTGLGLATVYGIVEQSGGCIQVESEEGVGTTFRILLPMTEGSAKAVEEEPGTQAGRNGGGETVLVVEDESSVRSLLVQLLRADGYRVLSAQDPNEAMEIAQSHTGDIDLLLTDVVMPHMSGTTLAKRMRAWKPSLRVALMSGYPDKGGPAEDQLDTSLPFLHKPFKRDVLQAFVQRVLEEPLREAG